ncbi:MAG: hypothetical protein A3J74_05960 [Elusimicrobia bacterium RIFCSPHIGHO2_02_FULL_57_9]|nr:MAG: hypothetical protein A3J74_05960 [Elusimicrobia bacterium RIFCSPHIGHO2_02_FULL_57_9]
MESLLKTVVNNMRPAVLFETFQPDAEQPLLSPLPGLAYSLVLATLGNWQSRQNPALDAPLAKILEEAALEDCIRFATSLLDEEAVKESCELSPTTALAQTPALETVLGKLDGSKIAVVLSEGKLCPPASLALSLSWLSKSKANKGKTK